MIIILFYKLPMANVWKTVLSFERIFDLRSRAMIALERAQFSDTRPFADLFPLIGLFLTLILPDVFAFVSFLLDLEGFFRVGTKTAARIQTGHGTKVGDSLAIRCLFAKVCESIPSLLANPVASLFWSIERPVWIIITSEGATRIQASGGTKVGYRLAIGCLFAKVGEGLPILLANPLTSLCWSIERPV